MTPLNPPRPTDDAPVPEGRYQRLRRDLVRWLRTKHVWNQAYRALSYSRSALWLVPLVAIALVLAFAPIVRILDEWLAWRITGLGVEGAKTLYQTVITLTLSFVVFTFGSLLVAIQVAGGQLTPRVIATALLRDNVVRFSVGLFVFTLMVAVTSLDRQENRVQEMPALICGVLGVACLAVFLFLIDYCARLLRPVSIIARIGDEGLGVLRSVYPQELGGADDLAIERPRGLAGAPDRVVAHVGASAIVIALDTEALLAEAHRTGGVIEFVPQVGDFLATGEPLFALYGAAAAGDDEGLRTTVALGSERTMEQDPLFAFRILVDIALKALSPAINDPTTATLALDQIHRLLRFAGRRRLQGNAYLGRGGRTCLLVRTPDWQHFVQIACTEIRGCGAGSVQVARRMTAMLGDLAATLPACRREALLGELARLRAALPPLYPQPEDLALACEPDLQGIGGSPGRHPAPPRTPPA